MLRVAVYSGGVTICTQEYASRRVAMRRDGVVQYLHGDHPSAGSGQALGSTSLATDGMGEEVLGSRTGYAPFGEMRYGEPPTDRRYTGQRWEQGLGLYDYNARFYDPTLGRFISADTIVPQPGNPQDFNRYAYVRNNPLRYTDPSGYYSEDEIMQSFGVSAWNQVLAHFMEGGTLAGRWGWLEILRQAQDSDWVEAELHKWVKGFGWAPTNCEEGTWCGSKGGYFSRNEEGRILVGYGAHSEFALQYDEYTLHTRTLLGYFGDYPFHTRAEWIHYHPKYDWGRVDKEDIGIDASGIALSFLEAVPSHAWAAMRAGWTLDAYSISKDLAEWDQMGQPGPQEAMGI